jgi:hypothetical protein
MKLLSAASLSSAPRLDSLGLPESMRSGIAPYLAETPWGGYGIVTGPAHSEAVPLFYALLAEQCQRPHTVFVADHIERFVLPQPPRRHGEPPAAPLSFEEAFARQDESRTVQVIVDNAQEYAEALSSFSRWDPDLVAAGEVPNAAVAAQLLQLSFTGARVLARLEERSVGAAIEYIRHMSPEIAHALQFVIVALPTGFEFRDMRQEPFA